MKHVGLNVAADPLFTLSYTGVNGGLVICVADDPGMHSSQNEQDSRHYAEAAKLPMVEPSDSAEAKEFAKWAFEISEKFDTPVIYRTCTRIAHSQGTVELLDRANDAVKPYEKQPQKFIMAPANAIKRHPVVEARQAEIAFWAEDCPLNRVEMAEDRSLGIITSGTCYQYVKEILGDSVSVLKLGLVNPLPEKAIRDFAAAHERIVVIEELDPYIENYCKALGLKVEGKNLFPITGEFSQRLIAEKLGKKARKLGFDFDDADEAMQKVYEEADEVKAALSGGNKDEIHEEFGDLLLSIVNAARLAGVDAEKALYDANEKFLSRFERVEALCLASGKTVTEASRKEKEYFWQESKKN
jgi:indolepyruvate ferredoxin oxidoreductase alpha subunit